MDDKLAPVHDKPIHYEKARWANYFKLFALDL